LIALPYPLLPVVAGSASGVHHLGGVGSAAIVRIFRVEDGVARAISKPEAQRPSETVTPIFPEALWAW
jgi:hypothetical protein